MFRYDSSAGRGMFRYDSSAGRGMFRYDSSAGRGRWGDIQALAVTRLYIPALGSGARA